MGCGCNKSRKENAMTQSVVPPHAARTAFRAPSPRGGSYSEGMSCRMCYVKHLSRAAIELAEYSEDRSRYQELAMCIGDLSCAEDHASSLGLETEVSEIRSVRKSLENGPARSSCDALRDMAARQLAIAMREAGQRQAPPPVPPEAAKEDSND